MRHRILITGGHMTPAISIIQEIKKYKPEWDIHFVGRMYAMEGDKEVSEEYKIIKQMGVSFYPLHAGRVHRFFSFRTLGAYIKIPWGYWQAHQILQAIKPDVIVSFGGYIALPIVLASIGKKIPVVTHEQTSVMGLSNRIIAYFAKRVFLTFPHTFQVPYSLKTDVIGLPVRQGLLHPPQKPSFAIARNLPIIYITGGSTGAQFINEKVFLCIYRLLDEYIVIHQTGARSFSKANRLKESLPEKLKNNYVVQAFFDESDIAWIYKNTSLVIGRSGANTVYEVAITGNIACFMPLPHSGGGEQIKNATLLETNGSATILTQGDLSTDNLIHEVQKLAKDSAMKKKAKIFAKKFPHDSAHIFMNHIEKLIYI